MGKEREELHIVSGERSTFLKALLFVSVQELSSPHVRRVLEPHAPVPWRIKWGRSMVDRAELDEM
jgi:hypothetical protein